MKTIRPNKRFKKGDYVKFSCPYAYRSCSRFEGTGIVTGYVWCDWYNCWKYSVTYTEKTVNDWTPTAPYDYKYQVECMYGGWLDLIENKKDFNARMKQEGREKGYKGLPV